MMKYFARKNELEKALILKYGLSNIFNTKYLEESMTIPGEFQKLLLYYVKENSEIGQKHIGTWNTTTKKGWMFNN